MLTLDIPATLKTMADRLRECAGERPVMIGIHTGGVLVAENLHGLLGLADPLGTLDIAFYRDDYTRVGVNPQVKTSHLPVHVEGRHVILVDDVLHTGRTIRAALNEIFDYGRPASVTLAVLLDRGGRELPVCPQVAGHTLILPASQRVKLHGPDPLRLVMQHTPVQNTPARKT